MECAELLPASTWVIIYIAMLPRRFLRFLFITSTPLDVIHGSGTYVGIHVLAQALQNLGHQVEFAPVRRHFPIYTMERLWYNRGLRALPASNGHDFTVGFDMDGYRITGSASHIASLKGVLADEVRFEHGLTRLTMAVQARCEWLHVHRAARVVVSSRYSGDCVQQFYGLKQSPVVVPEPIDLDEWRRHLQRHPASSARFTVLFVGRFYRRKRVDVLLHAAARLREISNLEVRIVGNGPCAPMLHRLARALNLQDTVTWLGDVSRTTLAAEYNRAHVFCLPSVQEGFGIVLLEAMAAGKPIVASRAAAIPEVAPHAALVEPDQPEAFAGAIAALHGACEGQAASAEAGLEWVKQFDAPLVARRFVEAVSV